MEDVECAHGRESGGDRESIGRASRSDSQFMLLFLAVAAMVSPSAAALYKVGDSAGWTSTGNVNYSSWANSKIFRVGDIIAFEYNPQTDNVLEATRDEYHNCSSLSPLATFSTGNDTFLLRRTGHRFFLSGFPAHCAAGQKVDIRIPKLRHHSAAPAKSPSHSPFPSSSSSSSSSATPNRAAHTKENPALPQDSGGAAGHSSLALAMAFAFLLVKQL